MNELQKDISNQGLQIAVVEKIRLTKGQWYFRIKQNLKLLLFLFLLPVMVRSQVYPTKVKENPLMPIVCGTPVLVEGKPDSFLLKMATPTDRRIYKRKVVFIWLDIYRKPLFYDKRGKLINLKLKQ